jgi:hypothetical protein
MFKKDVIFVYAHFACQNTKEYTVQEALNAVSAILE